MKSYFESYGLRFVMKPQEKKFEIQKEVDGLIFSYPYSLTADTLRRMIFYDIAIDSNENSTLIFEEPESNAFPYYTKQFGEKIAIDESNQFFIVTHNPYLLKAIIEKSDKNELGVFVTYFESFETFVKMLSSEQISDFFEKCDPFLSLNRFIQEI